MPRPSGLYGFHGAPETSTGTSGDGGLQVAILEQAVGQKDAELRTAAAAQREAGEALRRAGARAERSEQDAAELQARNLELQRMQSAAEAEESDSLQQLRQQVPVWPLFVSSFTERSRGNFSLFPLPLDIAKSIWSLLDTGCRIVRCGSSGLLGDMCSFRPLTVES